MKRIGRFYRYANILSLDIAAGAVISAIFFSRILDVQILPYGLIALALTVWIIYTADHLRDAFVIGKTASSDRHRFHQKYFKQLIVLVLIAAAVDVALILYTRKPVFRWGINLSSIVVIYLVIQHYLKFLKEIFVAVLYTCGVLLPSFSVTDVPIVFAHYLLFGHFALVALINLFIFSWYDFESDIADNQRSFATTVGKDSTRKIIYMLAGFISAIWLYLLRLDFEVEASTIIFIMMMLHLLILFLHKQSVMQRGQYRLFVEAIFFVPIITWLN